MVDKLFRDAADTKDPSFAKLTEIGLVNGKRDSLRRVAD